MSAAEVKETKTDLIAWIEQLSESGNVMSSKEFWSKLKDA
jgi:hypothetical protein